MKRFGLILFILFQFCRLWAQENFTVDKDLSNQWLEFEQGKYIRQADKLRPNSEVIYFEIKSNQYPQSYLALQSDKIYFVFINGKLSGEYKGRVLIELDSLRDTYQTPSLLVGLFQPGLNTRNLKTEILSRHPYVKSKLDVKSKLGNLTKPSVFFKDFVVVSGLLIMVLFLIIMRLNPKLAGDYFSVIRIFSLREGDDSQSNARLTSSTNVQFYVSCSLLVGFYLLIIVYHLPPQYLLPVRFQANSFWSAIGQWIRLSSIVLAVFFIKILLVFSLTRLFSMRGIARVHFFNWVRVLLIVFGAGSIIIFTYFILRGRQEIFFITFLSLVAGALIAWVLLAFLKLNGKSEHSMFHLFSYICATEIIPLLITVKVLFQ